MREDSDSVAVIPSSVAAPAAPSRPPPKRPPPPPTPQAATSEPTESAAGAGETQVSIPRGPKHPPPTKQACTISSDSSAATTDAKDDADSRKPLPPPPATAPPPKKQPVKPAPPKAVPGGSGAGAGQPTRPDGQKKDEPEPRADAPARTRRTSGATVAAASAPTKPVALLLPNRREGRKPSPRGRSSSPVPTRSSGVTTPPNRGIGRDDSEPQPCPNELVPQPQPNNSPPRGPRAKSASSRNSCLGPTSRSAKSKKDTSSSSASPNHDLPTPTKPLVPASRAKSSSIVPTPTQSSAPSSARGAGVVPKAPPPPPPVRKGEKSSSPPQPPKTAEEKKKNKKRDEGMNEVVKPSDLSSETQESPPCTEIPEAGRDSAQSRLLPDDDDDDDQARSPTEPQARDNSPLPQAATSSKRPAPAVPMTRADSSTSQNTDPTSPKKTPSFIPGSVLTKRPPPKGAKLAGGKDQATAAQKQNGDEKLDMEELK